jgi:hypothetical protein
MHCCKRVHRFATESSGAGWNLIERSPRTSYGRIGGNSAPDAGESAGSLGASVEPAPLGAEVRPDAQGYLKLTQSGVRDSFAQDLTDTEKLVLYSAQSPTAGAALGGTVSAMLSHPKEVASLIAG